MYQVLKSICMTIAFEEQPDTASYNWQYTGGCYGEGEEGSDVAVYEPAVVGETYAFDAIPVEVREDNALMEELRNAAKTGENLLSILLYALYWVFLILAGASLVMFVVTLVNGMKGGSGMRPR